MMAIGLLGGFGHFLLIRAVDPGFTQRARTRSSTCS